MIYEHERKPKRTYYGPPVRLPAESHDDALNNMMNDYLDDRELPMWVARASGWYVSGSYVPRIIIPCTTGDGRAYYQGRRMDDDDNLRYCSPPNPAGDAVAVVWPLGSNDRRQVVVVEGPMDALAAAGLGFTGVALMGCDPPPERLAHVVKMFGRTHAPFIILPDAGAEDFGAGLTIAFAGLSVQTTVILPVGEKDLAAMDLDERINLLTPAKEIPWNSSKKVLRKVSPKATKKASPTTKRKRKRP